MKTSLTSKIQNVFRPIIAIIEENDLIRKRLALNLQSFNYQALEIDEPMRGISQLMKHTPDLMIIATELSTVDGYSVCKFLKSTPIFKNIPIILSSSYHIEKSHVNFVGADDVLVKPIDTRKLESLVNSYVSPSMEKYALG